MLRILEAWGIAGPRVETERETQILKLVAENRELRREVEELRAQVADSYVRMD